MRCYIIPVSMILLVTFVPACGVILCLVVLYAILRGRIQFRLIFTFPVQSADRCVTPQERCYEGKG